VANALLFNQSIKFLNLSLNSFASRDYDLSAKLARVIQVHPNLVHLDLTAIQVRREEAMYIGQCLKDSSNLVSCHLTGNQIDYYSRLYLRAQLNAIVQFPMSNTHTAQTTVQGADRTQVLALTRQVQQGVSNGIGGALAELKKEDSEYFDDVLPEHSEADQRRLKQIAEEGAKARKVTRPFSPAAEEEPSAERQGSRTAQDQYVASPASTVTSRTQTFVHSQKTPVFSHPSSSGGSHFIDEGQQRLKKYLEDKDTHIYDMLQQLDIYGTNKRREDKKQEFMRAFPDSELAKALVLEELAKRRPLSKLDLAALLPNETPRISSKEQQMGTISEQNQMARIIAGLATNFDERMAHQNPMNGFLKEVIFTRYIGHHEVDSHEVWRDCSQCWICEHWAKATVQYYDPDVIHDR